MVKCGVNRFKKNRYVWKNMRQPGIEPGSIAWKATMLTFTPPTLMLLGKARSNIIVSIEPTEQ